MSVTSPIRSCFALACTIACCVVNGVAGAAELDVASRHEINVILTRIVHSNCEFYRSGTWHDAASAHKHIDSKYRVMAGRGLLGSTEDFIAQVATRSSMTDEPYAIRCPNQAAQPSATWLLRELRALRNPVKAGGHGR